MINSIEFTPNDAFEHEELRQLYAAVGWSAYTADVPALATAIANSTYVVSARARNELIGLARVLSDDVSIFYLQDILVHPDYQHRGLGSSLLAACLERFDHVRQKVLLTDDQPSQHRFYESMGFADTSKLESGVLRCFVRMPGIA